jgi:hypothetical protein
MNITRDDQATNATGTMPRLVAWSRARWRTVSARFAGLTAPTPPLAPAQPHDSTATGTGRADTQGAPSSSR